MKKLIILPLLWMACVFVLGQQVTGAEYFLDEDPGYGKGTPIAMTSGSSIETILTIPPDALEPGLHNLYLRVKDSNGAWSQTIYRPFLMQRLSSDLNPDISAMEYFFDNDPGFGLASSIEFQANPEISVAMDLPLDTLSDGIHTLYVRARDDRGSWGMIFHRNFLVQRLPRDHQIQVTQMEYFFDEDPGFGLGTLIEFQSDAEISVAMDLPLDTLSDGVHTLYVRAQDNRNSWGLTFMRTFLKHIIPDDPAKVASLEYFVNADPGFGNGTRIDLNKPAGAAMKYFVVDPGQLQAGTNILYVRALDSRGNWGHVQSTPFEVLEAAPCDPPADLAAGGVTDTTSSLGWTAEGTSAAWDLMWLPSGLDYTEESILDTGITDNPHTVDQLMQSTLYNFYVRSVCTDGQVSDWAGPGVFHTLPLPVNPLTLLADPPEGGTLSGAGSYSWGETVQVTATANSNFQFINWSGDTAWLSNTMAAEASLTMPAQPVTLTAHFLDLTAIEDHPGASLRVYPNPAGEHLWVEYYCRGGESITIRLIELRGRVVEQQILEGDGMQRVSFGTSGLSPGIYMLTVCGKQWNVSRRVVIVR
ncbi:MAG: T9SS type A sorting domain-containing protein [Bacteroidales bacterium]|nr:T9SS type A sorting domain-containing protein [Bacteroidales bacterium]